MHIPANICMFIYLKLSLFFFLFNIDGLIPYNLLCTLLLGGINFIVT